MPLPFPSPRGLGMNRRAFCNGVSESPALAATEKSSALVPILHIPGVPQTPAGIQEAVRVNGGKVPAKCPEASASAKTFSPVSPLLPGVRSPPNADSALR